MYFINTSESDASRDWPQTTGEITYLSISKRSSGGQKITGEGNSSSGSTMYELKIEYVYTVDNKVYTGTRISHASNTYRSKKDAQLAMKPYAAGQFVQVWYDPDYPKRAVLKAGEKVSTVFLIVGLVFTLSSAGLMIVAVRNRIKDKRLESVNM